jgi:hypothetical protein
MLGAQRLLPQRDGTFGDVDAVAVRALVQELHSFSVEAVGLLFGSLLSVSERYRKQ